MQELKETHTALSLHTLVNYTFKLLPSKALDPTGAGGRYSESGAGVQISAETLPDCHCE